MSRPQGLPKTGGRQRGVPNKNSFALKELLESQKCEPVTELLKTLPELEAKERADVYLNLLQYLYPKRKAIEQTVDPELLEVVQSMQSLNEEQLRRIVAGESIEAVRRG